MKQTLIDFIKNLQGKHTSRKYVVIAIDDYGNRRTHSNEALENMIKQGVKPRSRFDKLDHIESAEDLEMLYDTLRSVKDKNNNPAVFSPLSMTGNINFEEMEKHNFEKYIYEDLITSYNKVENDFPKEYKDVYKVMKQGINDGIFMPEFHGREHLNLHSLTSKLQKRDREVITALKNKSYSCISKSGFPNISYTASFEFEDINENKNFEGIIKQGLQDFEKVYGYKSIVFNSPGGREHSQIHKYLNENGIQFIETPWVKTEHQGNGKYKKILNYSGKKNPLGMTYSVRNVVFEPTDNRGFDWINYTMKQIDMAFRLKKPALISSHRVNFCGFLDPKNRKEGLGALKTLLQKITQKHPDVEFISLRNLCKELYV